MVVVVAMVVEVVVAVAGGVPFGHPHPQKMTKIIDYFTWRNQFLLVT